MLSKLRNILKDFFPDFPRPFLYSPFATSWVFMIVFYRNGTRVCEKVYRNRNNVIQHGDVQRDAHKPDVGCNNWMLCSVKGILAVTTVNLLSQFF